MKKLLSLCLLSFSSFSAVAAADDFVFRVGMDAQVRSMPLQKGLGDNLVKKSYPQGAVYGSMRFNESFGLELGYQRSVVANRREVLDGNEAIYFNDVFELINPDYMISRSKVSTQGLYTGVLGFLPISEEYRLKGIASLGVVRMKTKIISAIDLVEPTGTTTDLLLYNFVQTKWVPKLSIGLQHMINDHLGVRALAGWEKTSEFKHIKGIDATDGIPDRQKFASLKNSTTLGLGLFYDF